MTPPRRLLQPDARRLRLVWLLLGAAVLLAACGSQAQDDRRFANEPVTDRPPTETPVVTEPLAPTATVAPMASPATLLTTRGAPDTLYTLAGGDLVVISPLSGAKTHPIDLPDGRALLGFDASPSGDRVAVLLGPGNEAAGEVSLLIFGRDGKEVGKPRTIKTGAAAATSASGEEAPGYSVGWSPQGNAVLVAAPSTLVNVPAAGEPAPIALDGVKGLIRAASWSPQGSQIALLVGHEDGSQEVVLLRTGAKKATPIIKVPAGSSIEQLAWLPDGSGLVYLRANLIDGVPMGGQLFLYRIAREASMLVATSGQGGPSATIATMAPSPDGRSVAYVISIRDGDRWSFHSLWVRSLSQPLSYEVPVENAAVVSRVWWVARGLAWEQAMTEAPGAPAQIVFANVKQQPTVIFQAASPAPGASPVASPAAAPVASPQATPGT